MKLKLSQILIICSLTTAAQVHQFGAGIGQGEGIREIKLEGFYSFNYKLMYTKLNYIYSPNKTYYYKNTSQTILLLGIQSPPDYKLIGHVGLGARAYFPTKNDNYASNTTYDQTQINPFLNTGVSYEFIKHNCVYLNIYIGRVIRKYYFKDYYNSIDIYPDRMLTIGYAYSFKQKTRLVK